VQRSRPHPLDRSGDESSDQAEAVRIRLAWARLLWLLAFLGVLLAISYLVPYIAEQTQYAITRGKQRAEHDFAREHLGESPIADMSRAYQMVSQVVGPSVVHINTQGPEQSLLPLSTRRVRIPTEGQGSGIVMEPDGYILTNNHVIRGANEIHVSLADGTKLKADVVGRDPATDLAVIKVDAAKLIPAAWGDSEGLERGAMVWAVGSPFGLEQSITSGILSAKHRAGLAGSPHQDFLQTDAAVNPGNSGGPLVDVRGRVIGINTAIVGDSFQGISFAIPSNLARGIYEKLKAEGLVRRGWLGVQLEAVTAERAHEAGLSQATGVLVVFVFEQGNQSPASKAGMQRGDIVLRWNDSIVMSPSDLRRLVEQTPVGSSARVLVMRDGREQTLDVVVGERPPELD
jgi:S1-C subfamily serine protease